MYFHERSGVAHKNAGQKCRKMSEKGDGENVSKPRSETSIKPSGIKPRSVYIYGFLYRKNGVVSIYIDFHEILKKKIIVF